MNQNSVPSRDNDHAPKYPTLPWPPRTVYHGTRRWRASTLVLPVPPFPSYRCPKTPSLSFNLLLSAMPEEDENAQQTEDLRDEEMESGAKKLYLFLCSLTVDMLGLHCRNVHIKSTPVVRASLIARLYKFSFEHVNMQPSDMCKTIEKSKQLLKSFESFCKDWDVHSRKDVPTHSYVMRLGSIDFRADPTALTNLHESLTSRSRITSHARNSSSKKQGAKSRNHGSGSTNGSLDHRGTGSEAPARPADDANSMKTADPFSISEFVRLFLLLVRDIECRDALFKSGKPLSRQQLDRGEFNSTFWT